VDVSLIVTALLAKTFSCECDECGLHSQRFLKFLRFTQTFNECLDRSDVLNTLAALAALYRHARLSAVKLAGDPNNPARFKDDATADELREEIMRHIARLSDAGVIDLKALPVPAAGVANRPSPGVDQSGINGE
jgi:hypothetical protein